MEPMRFGLVGTGYWARIAHAPALASTDGIELTAVWGRDPKAAAELGERHGAAAVTDFDEFLSQVDAVGFAVPPEVQGSLARRAAAAGKHLLLEKPIALSVADADGLVTAVRQAGVASVVFFTAQFQADVRSWLAEVASRDDWAGGSALWLGSALQDDSPFNTPWRRAKGGLWDLGPHLITSFWVTLGPVVSVTADQGAGGVAHLVLHHESGITSAISVTMSVPEQSEYAELLLWGPGGKTAAPWEAGDPVVPLRTALTELVASARSGQPAHRFDVTFGREIVRVLADAQTQLDGARSAPA
jgi:predicted dehydrogenase